MLVSPLFQHFVQSTKVGHLLDGLTESLNEELSLKVFFFFLNKNQFVLVFIVHVFFL